MSIADTLILDYTKYMRDKAEELNDDIAKIKAQTTQVESVHGFVSQEEHIRSMELLRQLGQKEGALQVLLELSDIAKKRLNHE